MNNRRSWLQNRSMVAGLVITVIVCLVGVYWFFGRKGNPPGLETTTGSTKPSGSIHKGPPHPGLVLQSPFQNVRPDVAYAGDEACASCHAQISESFRAHPMGRSIAKVGEAQKVEQFGEPFHSLFSSGGFVFESEMRGDQMVHRETLMDGQGKQIAEVVRNIRWVVGSGTRGRSYLVDQDGFLFQSPLTWYVETKRWDLAPQYEKANLHFGRPITPECLFCHCNQAEPKSGKVNQYSKRVFHGAAIGCERCHGAGQLHVAHQTNQPTDTKKDLTIANPRHMEHKLREDVCWQCHLQSAERVVRRGREAFDYRPGLPLEEFLRDYLKTEPDPGEPQFVGAVPQMLASRCYQKSESDTKLGCISCHDPHAMPSETNRIPFYRQRCLNCHEKQPCSLAPDQRRAEQDSCIACHMPRTASKFPHLSISDHRVPRKPGPVSANAGEKSPTPSTYPLVPLRAATGTDADRDLGIALQSQADKRPFAEAQKLAGLALPLLKGAAAADPEDVAALYAQAKSHWYLGQKAEALKTFEMLLDRFPDEENALYNASVLATQMGGGTKAVAWAKHLVEINPWRWEYYQVLADAHALTGNRKEAEAASRTALRLNPAGLMNRRPSSTPLVPSKGKR